MAKHVLWALSSAHLALVGCSSSESDLSTEPPTTLTKVTSGGFSSPTDAVASPDGKTFYFAAYDNEREPAIFKTSSAPGSIAELLAVGAPLASPMGLVLSCDGATLYIADLAAAGADETQLGAVFSLSTGGGAVSDLGGGISRPTGLAMEAGCKTLHVTGRSADGLPGVFTLSTEGGLASSLFTGEPLVSPSGIHVDDDGVSWVMDHRASGAAGEGVLWAIPRDGSRADEVASDLRMGTPGGVSLVAGGGTAVMPTRDREGTAQLTSVNITTGETLQLAAPDIVDVGGLRTARKAGVFALVDTEGSAIYRAE
jgi:hypothetical protein